MGEDCSAGALFDTHTHLNHPRLMRRLPEVLDRARAAGVRGMMVVGYDLESSEQAVSLAEEHDDLWAAVGVHPHDAETLDAAAVARLRALAGSRKVAAIGETGLDYYRDLSPRDRQREAFRRHLDLAAELELPVIVHCREAQDEILAALDPPPPAGAVWHCFDGSSKHAARAVGLGLVLGFGGMVTYRGSEALRRAAATVALERILLETDCPYLSPEPHRNRDNEPANVALVAQALADLRGIEAKRLGAAAWRNARRFFRLSEESAHG